MKINRLRIAGLAILEGALLFGLIWLLRINRNEWIIRMGILQADRLIMISWIGWAALAILINLALLFAWIRQRKLIAAAPIKLTFSPERFRIQLNCKRNLQGL
jgi:hypothetical protein